MTEFRSSRKVRMKMEEYLIKMKSLANNLKLIGNPISITNLIIQTLAILDFDIQGYNSPII
uniref:Retrovirus-related Pol polyprotein from transposon TNT 1-94 n=1 Tax=Cajanus cajan TaxID=3821 RepID=A0A151T9J0_CAJCA|nr:hypothetical protein KK1_018312 [Cajanus cajan]